MVNNLRLSWVTILLAQHDTGPPQQAEATGDTQQGTRLSVNHLRVHVVGLQCTITQHTTNMRAASSNEGQRRASLMHLGPSYVYRRGDALNAAAVRIWVRFPGNCAFRRDSSRGLCECVWPCACVRSCAAVCGCRRTQNIAHPPLWPHCGTRGAAPPNPKTPLAAWPAPHGGRVCERGVVIFEGACFL